MDIPILYEDNHLLIVEKPVNVPVQEDNSKDRDLLTILKADIKDRYQKPGNVYLGLVHRLDRPVGGVMVFAKTSKAASRLSEKIRTGEFERKYLAIVRGRPPQEQGTLKHYLVKNHNKNKVFVVSKKDKKAKIAILEYETIQHYEKLSLVSVRLHTGRSHQIRVQFASSGCPLYGDQKYGENINKPGEQIALWSHSIKFEHPTKKEIIEIKSTPPINYPWSIFDSEQIKNSFTVGDCPLQLLIF
ncbi:RluA family pseudouridine synthase [Bacillus kwashiorkori]|uniref:RluA family pseudouridine synthase n=1 Tax=Bacillus kwashiorkori TaxID=1522318 RepID=UPI00078634A2|nr:RNA pseudouridine synthase [Bacillus kwashiorkori]